MNFLFAPLQMGLLACLREVYLGKIGTDVTQGTYGICSSAVTSEVARQFSAESGVS